MMPVVLAENWPDLLGLVGPLHDTSPHIGAFVFKTGAPK